jgi:hypothetical protein
MFFLFSRKSIKTARFVWNVPDFSPKRPCLNESLRERFRQTAFGQSGAEPKAVAEDVTRRGAP